MESIQNRLLEALERNGYQGRIVALHRLRELQEELGQLYRDGLVDKEFYEKEFTGFVYEYTDQLPAAKSVIIAAIPQPITRLTFPWNGRQREVLLPPTYIGYGADSKLQNVVEAVLQEGQYSLVPVYPPLKLLAVRSGLSRYGRNNITYVEGMGSFNRLVAWATDLDCGEDFWQKGRRMPECDQCRACLQACPTGCIDADRKVIHAETCLTNLNEYREPFPEWVDIHWHHALVGCLSCQTACPKNKAFLEPETWPEVFTEEEISLLLGNTELDSLPEKTRDTLMKLSMRGYYKADVLHRNLRILLERE